MHNFSYLRVMSMGGHFFLQTWICMAMIFEPYLGCYGSILSPDLVCCSWDYGLSIKWSSILNRMSGTCSNFQFILLKHITLICQHDKLPLVSNCFCMKNTQTISQKILYEFWERDISRTESTIMLKFLQYLCHQSGIDR